MKHFDARHLEERVAAHMAKENSPARVILLVVLAVLHLLGSGDQNNHTLFDFVVVPVVVVKQLRLVDA